MCLLNLGIKPWRSGRMEGLYILRVTPLKCLCQLICISNWKSRQLWLSFLPFSFTFQLNKYSLASSLLTRSNSRKGHQTVVKSSFCFCLTWILLQHLTLLSMVSLFWKSPLFFCMTLPSWPSFSNSERIPFYPSCSNCSFCSRHCLYPGWLHVHCLSILGPLLFSVYIFFLTSIVFYFNNMFLNW